MRSWVLNTANGDKKEKHRHTDQISLTRVSKPKKTFKDWLRVRKSNRLRRANKRQQFIEKHPELKILTRIVIYSTIASCVLFSAHIAKQLHDDYQNSKKWTKLSANKMADMDVETLYATAAEKQARIDYVTYRKKIWNSEKRAFQQGYTKDDVEKMQAAYKLITNKKSLEEEYNELSTYLSIKQNITNVFTDGSETVIKKDVTVNTLASMVVTNFDLLKPYLSRLDVSNEAITLQTQLYNLAEDTAYMKNSIEAFVSLIEATNENKVIKGSTKALANDLALTKETLSAVTQHKWELVESVLNKIIEKADKAAATNQSRLTDEANYKEALGLEATFKEYLKQYQTQEQWIKDNIIDMPDFENMLVDDAIRKTQDVGLGLKIEYEESTRVKDMVLRQYPATSSYKKVFKGSTIRIVVAKEQRPTASSSTTSSSSSETETSTSSSSSSSSASSSTD